MTAHKILIGTACVFFLFFAASQWMGVVSAQGEQAGQATPWSAAMGLVAAAVLAVYLMTLKGK